MGAGYKPPSYDVNLEGLAPWWLGGFFSNSTKWGLVMLITIVAGISHHWVWFLLPFFVLLANDIAWWCGVTIFHHGELVAASYTIGTTLAAAKGGVGVDLGFNVYDGDLSLTCKEAQKKKYGMMVEALGLKEGMTLVDCGCGYGDWLEYTASLGCTVVGINISDGQVAYCRSRGLKVFQGDWKHVSKLPEFMTAVGSNAHAITFMDTIEHYVPTCYRDTPHEAAIIRRIFGFAHSVLRPGGKFFTSCLHETRALDFKVALSRYFLERTVGGTYPRGHDGLTAHAKGLFREKGRWDRTEDYRLTGLLNPAHFTNASNTTVKWTPYNVMYIIVSMFWSPFFILQILQTGLGMGWRKWYWPYGEDAFELSYDVKGRARKTFVTDWFICMERL